MLFIYIPINLFITTTRYTYIMFIEYFFFYNTAVFPFITYYVLNKSSVSNPREVAVNVRNTTLKKFDPRAIKHTTDHTFDLFTEVANIVCPPMSQSKRPRSTHTAYIISVYKVFDGDDSEKFEKHWLYWTGT